MSKLYSFPVFGFVDSNIAVYNYLCLQIGAEERHLPVKNRASELSADRGRVVVLRERMLCLDDLKSYNL